MSYHLVFTHDARIAVAALAATERTAVLSTLFDLTDGPVNWDAVYDSQLRVARVKPDITIEYRLTKPQTIGGSVSLRVLGLGTYLPEEGAR